VLLLFAQCHINSVTGRVPMWLWLTGRCHIDELAKQHICIVGYIVLEVGSGPTNIKVSPQIPKLLVRQILCCSQNEVTKAKS